MRRLSHRYRVMDVEGALDDWLGAGSREADLVANRLMVVGKLAAGIVNRAELPQHPYEVRLPARQQLGRVPERVAQRSKTQMLAVEDLLRLHQLVVEAVEGQRRGEHCVLHVEQPVVAGGEI